MQQNQQMLQSNPELMQQMMQETGISSDMEVDQADNGINYQEMYQSQLSQLANLGFTNQTLNIQILKSCDGNVDTAANLLFDQS